MDKMDKLEPQLPPIEQEVKQGVQFLFYQKYQFGREGGSPITKFMFMGAGWTSEEYFEYCSYLHEMYALCLSHELMGEHYPAINFSDYFRKPPFTAIENFLRIRLYRLTGLNISLSEILGKGLGLGTELWTREPKTVVYYDDKNPHTPRPCPMGLPLPFTTFVARLEYHFGWVVKEIREGTYLPNKDVSAMSPKEWAEEEKKSPYYFDVYQMTAKQVIAKKDEILRHYDEIRKDVLAMSSYSSELDKERVWLRQREIETLEFQMRLLEGRLEEIENGDFNLEGDTLLIYKGDNKCFREKHEIIPTTARVVARRGHRVDINVNYCYDCHKYFISEPEFFHYRDLYGIGCKLAIDRESSGYAHFPMAEYSILRLYGYNVGKNDDLSDEERKQILKMLIDHNFVSKPLIIKYLNQFIKMNGSRDNMEDCVSKWTEDLEYVRNLGMDTQDRVDIDEIKYAHS